jgi:hypothetical protein
MVESVCQFTTADRRSSSSGIARGAANCSTTAAQSCLNLAAASVVAERGLTLHVRLHDEPSVADREDLDEVIGDFEALIGQDAVIAGTSEVSTATHVGSRGHPVLPRRVVFWQELRPLPAAG